MKTPLIILGSLILVAGTLVGTVHIGKAVEARWKAEKADRALFAAEKAEAKAAEAEAEQQASVAPAAQPAKPAEAPAEAPAPAVPFAAKGAEQPGSMKKSDCFACHAVEKKLIGPSYRDVANKYRDQADAVAYLTEKIRNGGAGVWGEVPMAPHPKLTDKAINEMVMWILGQGD